MHETLPGLIGACQAVIFDLFHTLVEVLPEGPNDETTADILGVDRAQWSRVLWQDTHDRLVGVDRDPESIIRRAAFLLNPTIPEDRIARAAASRLNRFARALQDVPPGALKTLSLLRSAGKRVGLISNADVTEIAAWPRSPLAALFDSTVFSCEVRAKKPDAAIYEISLRELGVRAGDAVFVGDGGSGELEGARAAGLSTVMMGGIIRRLYPELISERRRFADFVIDDLEELLS